VLTKPFNGAPPEGRPLPGDASILELARQIVDDRRETLPVADGTGRLIGALDRQRALAVLFGDPA
jgi:glycine betaine/proline transport system ATP-binding protein